MCDVQPACVGASQPVKPKLAMYFQNKTEQKFSFPYFSGFLSEKVQNVMWLWQGVNIVQIVHNDHSVHNVNQVYNVHNVHNVHRDLYSGGLTTAGSVNR